MHRFYLNTILSLSCLLLISCSKSITDDRGDNNTQYSGYLFTYFTGNKVNEEQVYFALSADGFNFEALNNNSPVLNSSLISSSGGVRDPHILRAEDNSFLMVLTDLQVESMGWENTGIVLLKSPDLINWTHTTIDIPKAFPEKFSNVNRVWAPQTIFDEKSGKYMIYFSMRQQQGPDIIYYSYANDDFSRLTSEPKQLYYPPEWAKSKASIDPDIVKFEDQYYLFHKSEDVNSGIKLAISDSLTQGYKLVGENRVDHETNPVEGSAVYKLFDSNEYLLMYDVYTQGNYKFAQSTDLKSFHTLKNNVSMNFKPRHGSVIPVTKSEIDKLIKTWGYSNTGIVSSKSDAVKSLNITVNTEDKSVFLPVKSGTDLSKFDPKLIVSPGANISPNGIQDFTKGSIRYLVSSGQSTEEYLVNVAINNNPVLEGYYADPEIIYSKRDNKFYMYPTSDGFTSWSGTYFEAFSSSDLVNWENEGVILDLKKDVVWADNKAWAPAATEVLIDGEYKYFYYFSAAQKIGVATSSNPTGPFIDLGKPLIDKFPPGASFGQQIDPDIFTDPVSGKHYLYWGNGYMAVAELGEDMMSIKAGSEKLLTPDSTYREATEVFYRDGTYYFIWSENDTRDPEYRLRYATAKSPTGPLFIPNENLILEQDPQKGLFATGHNSVIQQPDTDNWFIIYHRFVRPNGIKMGRAAGYHREVSIESLKFNSDGTIKHVIPSTKGVTPISLLKNEQH